MENQRKDTRPIDSVGVVSDMPTVLLMREKILKVHVDGLIKRYILDIINKTRSDDRLALGVSPRGSAALFRGSQALASLRGRDYVVPEDVKDIALPVLAKRVLIRSRFTSRGLTESELIDSILSSVPVPGYHEARGRG